MSALQNDIERRVLGHLVIYREADAQAAVEATEIEAGHRSIAAFTTAELTRRLQGDKDAPKAMRDALSMGEAEGFVLHELEALAERQLVARFEDSWRMTLNGREALEALDEDTAAGPAFTTARMKEMCEFSAQLFAAGMVPGSHRFNRAGGITREGFRAWRAAHAEAGADQAELDAIEAGTPPTAEVEEPQDAPA